MKNGIPNYNEIIFTKEQKEDSSSELAKIQIQEQKNSNNTN